MKGDHSHAGPPTVGSLPAGTKRKVELSELVWQAVQGTLLSQESKVERMCLVCYLLCGKEEEIKFTCVCSFVQKETWER